MTLYKIPRGIGKAGGGALLVSNTVAVTGTANITTGLAAIVACVTDVNKNAVTAVYLDMTNMRAITGGTVPVEVTRYTIIGPTAAAEGVAKNVHYLAIGSGL